MCGELCVGKLTEVVWVSGEWVSGGVGKLYVGK